MSNVWRAYLGFCMLTVPERAGPARPHGGAPPRTPGSSRRTTSIDSSRPEGMQGIIQIDARGRDLVTGLSPGATRANEQRLTITLSPSRTVLSAVSEPAEPRLSQLIGIPVGPGFRGAVVRNLTDHADRQTLLHTLLDDLPGSALVSGYAIARADPPVLPGGPASGAFAQHIQDSEGTCAGWATNATIMVTFRKNGSVPTPLGPEAPLLDYPGDIDSWHTMAPLSPEATRRRRRLDLLVPTIDRHEWTFDSHFRDSYRDADNLETVIHEYTIDGVLDEDCRHLRSVRSDARVLPWLECPAALASTALLPGRALVDLRREVRTDLIGTGTCTHLNDSFRVLADLVQLHSLTCAEFDQRSKTSP